MLTAQRRKCVICGQDFWTRSHNQICCGYRCADRKKQLEREDRRQRTAVQKVCRVCGKVFSTTSKIRVTCSTECAKLNEQHVKAAYSKKNALEIRSDRLACDTRERESMNEPKMRKCHDCGRPTWNYRCEPCWAKRRKDLGYAVSVEYGDDEW